jgi:cutinase
MTAAIGDLPDDVKSQVVGAVLYGDTRNAQTDGSIPGYPQEDTLIICATGDGVCTGTLTVTAAHFVGHSLIC